LAGANRSDAKCGKKRSKNLHGSEDTVPSEVVSSTISEVESTFVRFRECCNNNAHTVGNLAITVTLVVARFSELLQSETQLTYYH